ncbi:hypothetical protein PR048_012654 [Dryococelus australis]|uniref:Peptidase A2 domain-containing protein n=1 Tax=Dryococelus australis TaxID=614101 RepID=A0ABQ9HPZ6_9NEOP|nr:hypothetical protein PR048_012654 [Dryococelus australis]
MSVSGHSSKSHRGKIYILCYVLADRAEEIRTQFERVPNTLELSLKAFSEYFTRRTNTIFERYIFNSPVQLPVTVKAYTRGSYFQQQSRRSFRHSSHRCFFGNSSPAVERSTDFTREVVYVDKKHVDTPRLAAHKRMTCPARKAKCFSLLVSWDTGHLWKKLGLSIVREDCGHIQWRKANRPLMLKFMDFLIDTGADITCVSISEVPGHVLKQAKRKTNKSKVFVISGLQTAILEQNCLQKLGVNLDNCCEVASVIGKVVFQITQKSVSPQEFVELRKGMGKMKGKVNIVLREGAKPFVQTVPRTLALSLLGKLKVEWDRVIALDNIVPVTQLNG